MIAEPILTNPIYNPLLLLLSLIALTFVPFAVRFVMIYGYYAYRTRRLKKKLNKYMKDMLLWPSQVSRERCQLLRFFWYQVI